MNSFVTWIGGKNFLKRAIYAQMPQGFDSYVEVFGGAAWVLFYQDKYAETEVYNDYDGKLVNLFRCVKYHRPELQRELSFLLNSRELFEDYLSQSQARGLTDIQRAARFFFLLKVSYGANRRSFGCTKKDVVKMIDYLARVEARLSSVIVENRDFEDLIRVYEGPDTFFYLDPPYYGSEKYYQVQFSEDDHVRLREALKTIKGKYLLSYNDCDYIRKLYKGTNIKEIERSHNLRIRYWRKERFKELLISNY